MEVVISGGEVSAIDLANRLINTVLALHLPKEVENSYMAKLKKVPIFIQSNKVTQAINQLDAFIHKVQIDIIQGKIGAADGNNLIGMATALIGRLN